MYNVFRSVQCQQYANKASFASLCFVILGCEAFHTERVTEQLKLNFEVKNQQVPDTTV